MVYSQKSAVILAAVLALGVILGYAGAHLTDSGVTAGAEITREGGYQYINPLLSCDISEDIPDSAYAPFVIKVSKVIAEATASGKAARVSVYFRDMNSGRWTGVNADGLYAPASLMKVPLYVAYLKASQTDTSLLQSSLFITQKDENASETIKPLKPLSMGRRYSVDDALRAMIVDSDNNAARALNDVVPNGALEDVYGDFGLPSIADEDANLVSPKMYMRLFRILYNASYMLRAKSQAALELMAQTTFADGLVAGVPPGTQVSHKFGEREVYAVGNTTPLFAQLHDCGIVYYPRAPYGICVMTEGADIHALEGVISTISRAAYDIVKNGELQ